MTLTASARALDTQDMHWLDKPHRSGSATVRMPGMPPQAPGYLEFGPLMLCGMERFESGYEGFEMHPHENTEIVTVLLEGHFTHRDSLGRRSVLDEGSVQCMSAGAGIEHEEMPSAGCRAIQLFFEPRTRDTVPSCTETRFDDQDRTRWQVLASGRHDGEGLPIDSDASVLFTVLEAGGRRELPTDKRHYVLVIRGKARVNGVIAEAHGRVLVDGPVRLEAKKDCEVLVIEVD